MRNSKESFKVKVSRKAKKFLDKLPQSDKERILSALRALRENPFAHDIKKLKGTEFYRLRTGKFRIIFYIDWENKVIVVFKIDKRERVYDRL